jgi:hypothetical protein
VRTIRRSIITQKKIQQVAFALTGSQVLFLPVLRRELFATLATAARKHFAAIGGLAPLEISVPTEAAPPAILS